MSPLYAVAWADGPRWLAAMAGVKRRVPYRDTLDYALRHGSETRLEIERMACLASGLPEHGAAIDARLAQMRGKSPGLAWTSDDLTEYRIMPGPMFTGRWCVESRALARPRNTYDGDTQLVPVGPWSVVSEHDTEAEARAAAPTRRTA